MLELTTITLVISIAISITKATEATYIATGTYNS